MLAFDRPKLSSLFVYCPHLCDKEGNEHKKVLYYFPPTTPPNDRLNSIGLCEAVMSFTNFFAADCRALYTSTTRRFFHKIAPDVWIVMVISLPAHTNSLSDYSIYHEHDANLSDQVMGALLSTACQTFELFNGKVDMLFHVEDVETIKYRLEHFFSRYLRTMLFEHCDILNCFNGIQFASVEPADFARVQGILSRIRYAFRCVQHVAFFYDGRLVHATVELDYACHLYHYLNSFLFVEQPDLSHSAVNTTDPKPKHLGRFLVGPKDLSDLSECVQCPVLCSPSSSLPDCQLITYQALRIVLCVVVYGVKPIPMSFFVHFDSTVGPQLTVLADRMAANNSTYPAADSNTFPNGSAHDVVVPTPVYLSALGAVNTLDNGVGVALEDFAEGDLFSLSTLGPSRLIYWNPCTFTVLSTLHVFTGSGKHQITGAKLILNLITSVRSELQLRPSSWHEEVVIRLDPHVWLVARRSNGREVYMVFVRKQESLAKLDASITQLYKSNFRGLFLLD